MNTQLNAHIELPLTELLYCMSSVSYSEWHLINFLMKTMKQILIKYLPVVHNQAKSCYLIFN